MDETQENNNNSIHTSDTNDEEYNSFKEFLSTPPGSPATSRQNTKDEVDDGKVEDNNDKKDEEDVVVAAAPVAVTTHTTRSSSSDELLEKGLPVATNTVMQQDDDVDDVEDYINNEQYKQNKCHRIMHFTSTILFVIGSVLYLIMSVKDYKWANKLNELPMYLRLADDDVTWIYYRLEEQYNASLLLDGEGGSGGVRRMKTRELWRMREEEAEAEEEAQGKLLEPGQVSAADASDAADSSLYNRRKLQTPEELYYDEDWNDLSPEIQEAYEILGFTEERWNEALIDEVWSEDADWIELTPEQLEAALLIGYTEAIWCEDGCDELVGETLTQNNDDPATTTATPSKAPTVKPITSSPTLRPVQTTLSPLPPPKPTTASPIQPVSDPIYWDDLTSGTQDIYTALGYNEEIWDSGGSAEVDSKSWSELDIKQRFALNALGWTKDTWDATEERFPTKPLSSIDKSESTPSPVRVTSSPTTSSPSTTSPSSSPTIALPIPDASVPTPSVEVLAPVDSSQPDSSPPAIDDTTTDVVEPCPCVALYEDEWWKDLPPDIQGAYGVLGYNETMWNQAIPSSSDELNWDDLSSEMQDAASLLGYTKEIWDADEGTQEVPPSETSPSSSLSNSNSTSTVSEGTETTVSEGTELIEEDTAEIGIYDNYGWDELPLEIQEAATTLGYSQNMWDLGVGVAFSEALFWDELSPEEQAAAALLGYSKQSWDNADAEEEEGTLASYVSYDDDYVIQGTAKNANLWISEYQIYYFFAALCFVFVGLLDLIRERHIFHVLMILAGSFGLVSSIYIEANIELSNVFNCVSVHLFLFEALYIFGDHKRSAVSFKTASWIKRTLMLGDLEFVVGALLDVILSYMYLFDDTSDWDISLTIVAIFAAVCWLHCSMIYIAAYFYAPEAVL